MRQRRVRFSDITDRRLGGSGPGLMIGRERWREDALARGRTARGSQRGNTARVRVSGVRPVSAPVVQRADKSADPVRDFADLAVARELIVSGP